MEALHIVLLHVGDAGPAVRGQLMTPGHPSPCLFNHSLRPCRDTFPHISFDILAGQSEANADRSVRIFWVDWSFDIGSQHRPLETVEVNDFAFGSWAEIRGFRNRTLFLFRQERPESVAPNRFTFGATARAIIGSDVRLSDEGFVHDSCALPLYSLNRTLRQPVP